MVLQSEPLHRGLKPASPGALPARSAPRVTGRPTDEGPWPGVEAEDEAWWPDDDGDEWPQHFGAARLGIP